MLALGHSIRFRIWKRMDDFRFSSSIFRSSPSPGRGALLFYRFYDITFTRRPSRSCYKNARLRVGHRLGLVVGRPLRSPPKFVIQSHGARGTAKGERSSKIITVVKKHWPNLSHYKKRSLSRHSICSQGFSPRQQKGTNKSKGELRKEERKLCPRSKSFSCRLSLISLAFLVPLLTKCANKWINLMYTQFVSPVLAKILTTFDADEKRTLFFSSIQKKNRHVLWRLFPTPLFTGSKAAQNSRVFRHTLKVYKPESTPFITNAHKSNIKDILHLVGKYSIRNGRHWIYDCDCLIRFVEVKKKKRRRRQQWKK